MIFRQLFEPQSSTYTYLLADAASREAILIDPVFEEVRREIALIEELGLKLAATLERHVHVGDITVARFGRAKLGSRIALSARSGAAGADIHLQPGDQVRFGNRYVEARATPGHTDGCMTFVTDDRSMAFTGDALLIRGCGRTDFQQGSARTLFRSVREQIFSLPDTCAIYPGHDYTGLTSSSVEEEKAHNPRLGLGIREEDFCGYMDNLGLAHPKKMEVAVPANLKCGKPDAPIALDADWAPVHLTFAGVPEIAPAWVEEHVRELQIVDVREDSEFNDELGHIRRARLIPLGQLGARLGELDKSAPTVVYCRSGARSARATLLMRQNGFERIANLSGGMLRWRALGLSAGA